MRQLASKTPADTVDRLIRLHVPLGDVTATSATATPAGLEILAVSWMAGPEPGLSLRLAGGAPATAYTVTCAIETADGGELIVSASLYVTDGAAALLAADPGALLVVNGVPLCVNGSKVNAW